MSIRYIGSKARMAETIIHMVGGPDGGRFIDAFCGMGTVAARAAQVGWSIHLNDALRSATIMSRARILAEAAVPFVGLSSVGLSSYADAVAALNDLPGIEGYMWRTYSPASRIFCDYERRYFTQANARRIDAIRDKIDVWTTAKVITTVERDLLLADLMEASNSVANTAGTFGCFLQKWQPGAEKTIIMAPRVLSKKVIDASFSVGDAADLVVRAEDTAYLDPPYTKRQYASYYHILETIAHGDAPVVEGVAGLRPWKHAASDFCYKRRALGALRRTVEGLRCHRVLLSYSDEGHMSLDEMTGVLGKLGRIEIHHLNEVGRYRPNKTASAARSQTREFIVELVREIA